MSATVSLGGAISVTVIRAASCDLFTFMEISSSDYGESLFHPGFDSQIMRDRDHGHGERGSSIVSNEGQRATYLATA